MCNQILDPGFLFDLNSNRVSICNRLDILREASVEIVFSDKCGNRAILQV